MLGFDDEKWSTLSAGYRIVIDLRPLLRRLENDADPGEAWSALWNELHHQGDVGVGSYVSVPHLVRIHRRRGVVDANTYAMVATIELARDNPRNPAIPEWARQDYEQALRDLAQLGLEELPRAQDSIAVRTILSVAAIVHGERSHALALLEFNGEELRELLERYWAG